MKRLNRIYYVPGILTLAIAPILITVSVDKYIAERTDHCIDFCMGVVNDDLGQNYLFPPRTYQYFQLNGNKKLDSLNIILIENIARGLQLSKNDSLGVMVVLGNKLKFKTYVNLFNSCLKSNVGNWIPLGDTVFIYHGEYPETYDAAYKTNVARFCEVPMGSDIFPLIIEPEYTLIQRIRGKWPILRLALPLFLIYLVLVVLAVRQFIRERRSHLHYLQGGYHTSLPTDKDVVPKSTDVNLFCRLCQAFCRRISRLG